MTTPTDSGRALRARLRAMSPKDFSDYMERRMDKRRMPWPEEGIQFPYRMVDSIEYMREYVWPFVFVAEGGA